MVDAPGRNGWDRDEAKRVILMLLERQRRRHPGQPPRPLTHRRLAIAAGVAPGCSVETRKRRVRELVDSLRRDGAPVVAIEGRPGCWLAETIEDHDSYEAALERHGVRRLMRARDDRRSQAKADAGGQLSMF